MTEFARAGLQVVLYPEEQVSTQVASFKKQNGFVKSSTLLLLAFATAFFPRVLTSAGAPSMINFVHFATIPLACGLAIANTRTRDQKQIAASKAFLVGLITLFTIVVASALLNKAGLGNLFLEFLLLSEPLMLLLAITSSAMSTKSVERFRLWVIFFASINLWFALVQKYILHYDRLRPIAGQDLIQGVFYFSGGGHVVSASISMTFGVYYFVTAKARPLWIRGVVLLAAIMQVIASDTKQVFLAFFMSVVVLLSLKIRKLEKILQYLAIFGLAIGALYGAVQSGIYENGELVYWLTNPDKMTNGLELKFSVFSIVPPYYHSSLNWLLGLGPGHTVGRLGGWMLRDYSSLLKPFDTTISPVSQAVWDVVSSNSEGDKSSLFSPFFGWAGIWGDLGISGLGAYGSILFLVWRHFCLDDLSKFILITVLAFGTIFTQLEEPGYMLFVVSLIGIRWQEHQSKKRASQYQVVQKQVTESISISS